MNLLKKLVISIISVLLAMNSLLSVSAFEGKDKHDEFMESILFGKDNYKDELSDTAAGKLDAIETAVALAIDQAGGKDTSYLDTLKDTYHIDNLPDSIDDIDVPSGYSHRMHSHLGWDHQYSGSDAKKWEIRKSIITETVKQELDFNKTLRFRANGKLVSIEYDSRLESFSALLYYIHILGDRSDDKKYYTNSFVMELGGRTDKLDIIDEIIKHCEVLFRDQDSSRDYIDMMSELKDLNNNVKPIVDRGIKFGETDSQDFIDYKQYAINAKDILGKHLPNLLKEEKFFRKAFL